MQVRALAHNCRLRALRLWRGSTHQRAGLQVGQHDSRGRKRGGGGRHDTLHRCAAAALGLGLLGLRRQHLQAFHHPGEDALVAPSRPTIVKGLRRVMFLGRITSPQPIENDEDHIARDPPIIDARLAVAFGEEGLQWRHLGRLENSPPDCFLMRLHPSAGKDRSSFSLLLEAELRPRQMSNRF